MKKSLVFLILPVLFLSCRKNSFDPLPSSEGDKLVSVYYGDEKFYEYQYDAQGRLAIERSKFHYHEFQYHTPFKTVSKKIYLDMGMASSDYRISNKSFNRTEWVNPANTPLYGIQTLNYDKNDRLVRSSALSNRHSEYEYDSEGRISAVKTYNKDVLSMSRQYLYDASGNLIRDDQYSISADGSKVLSSTTEYEYDQKKNPYRYQAPDNIPGSGTNPNNVTRKKYKAYSGYGEDVTYNYAYNGAGYPVSRNDGMRYVYAE